MKILFVLKSRVDNYNVSYGLVNSASFVARALHKVFDIHTKVVLCPDDNSIDKEIHQFKPNLVVIEALWCRGSKLQELMRLHKTAYFVIRVHSQINFLQTEGTAIHTLSEYVNIAKNHDRLILSGNHVNFTHDISQSLGHKFEYLPNIYWPEIAEIFYCEKPQNDHIDICSFGAIRPFKNVLTSAIASLEFADKINKKLHFRVNGNRLEQEGNNALKNIASLFDAQHNLKHELFLHNWMPHNEFLELMSKMDMSVSASYTESFQIISADAIFVSVPIVVTKAVEWAYKGCKVNPDSIDDITTVMLRAYKNPRKNIELNKVNLNRFNDIAIQVWEKFIFTGK